MAKSHVAIHETFKLPSAGKLYGDLIPEEVTLHAMTTMTEKIRLSSTNPFKTTPRVIKECLVDANFDPEDLKLFDLYFLMFKLREITYGSDYKVKAFCKGCSSQQQVTVDLSGLEVNYLEDGDTDPFLITLPVSGDNLACKYLSCTDLNRLQNEIERMKAKQPGVDESELGFIPGLCSRVVSINDETWSQAKLTQYFQEMHAKDYNYFEQKYAEITNKPGINLNYVSTCPKCGSPIIFEVPVLAEFFRPSID